MSSSLTFVGCGSSSGTPVASCLFSKKVCRCSGCGVGSRLPKSCKVCPDALRPGSRNNRSNPSALLRHGGKNILIDCGKMFKTAMLNVWQQYQDIDGLDAVLITHPHADAMLGLDDLREWTRGERLKETPIPVYVRDIDLPIIAQTFPYLVNRDKATGSGHVAKLDFHTYKAGEKFMVQGIEVLPIVVEHGEPCETIAFRMANVVYMSDVSVIPETALPMVACDGGLDLLVLDCTFLTRTISSHVNFPQAMDIVRQLQPKKTLLTGLTHDFDYYYWSPLLQRAFAYNQGLHSVGAQLCEQTVDVLDEHGESQTIRLPTNNVDLAFDGLQMEVSLTK